MSWTIIIPILLVVSFIITTILMLKGAMYYWTTLEKFSVLITTILFIMTLVGLVGTFDYEIRNNIPVELVITKTEIMAKDSIGRWHTDNRVEIYNAAKNGEPIYIIAEIGMNLYGGSMQSKTKLSNKENIK